MKVNPNRMSFNVQQPNYLIAGAPKALESSPQTETTREIAHIPEESLTPSEAKALQMLKELDMLALKHYTGFELTFVPYSRDVIVETGWFGRKKEKVVEDKITPYEAFKRLREGKTVVFRPKKWYNVAIGEDDASFWLKETSWRLRKPARGNPYRDREIEVNSLEDLERVYQIVRYQCSDPHVRWPFEE